MRLLSGLLIPFAEHKDTGRLLSVGDVPKGLACNCRCPSCKIEMLAKQGEVKAWHFAHTVRVSTDYNIEKHCEYSPFTAIRLMCQQILSKPFSIMLPPKSGLLNDKDGAKIVKLKKVKLASTIVGKPIDVLVNFENNYQLGIFISNATRQAPDEWYHLTSQKLGIVEVEADYIMSCFDTIEDGMYEQTLKAILSENTTGKRWVYHPKLAMSTRIEEFSDTLEYQPLASSSHEPLQRMSLICLNCDTKFQSIKKYCKRCQHHLWVTLANPNNG